MATNAQRALEHAARVSEAEADLLIRGAKEASKEVAASEKREAHVDAVARRAARAAQKVEAARAKLAAEAAEKQAKLDARLQAASERKLEVRYPPCARTKPIPVPVESAPTKRRFALSMFGKTIKGAVVALAGGAFAKAMGMFATKLLGGPFLALKGTKK